MIELFVDDWDIKHLVDYARLHNAAVFVHNSQIDDYAPLIDGNEKHISSFRLGTTPTSGLVLELSYKTRLSEFVPIRMYKDENSSDEDNRIYQTLCAFVTSSFRQIPKSGICVGPHIYNRWRNREVITSVLFEYDSLEINYRDACMLFARSAFDGYYVVKRSGVRKPGNTMFSELSSFQRLDRFTRESIHEIVSKEIAISSSFPSLNSISSNSSNLDVALYCENSKMLCRFYEDQYVYLFGSDALWCRETENGVQVLLDKRIKNTALISLFNSIGSGFAKYPDA